MKRSDIIEIATKMQGRIHSEENSGVVIKFRTKDRLDNFCKALDKELVNYISSSDWVSVKCYRDSKENAR